MTARDLLERTAGPDHALHSVVSKHPAERDFVRFKCSCGYTCMAENTAENKDALRNVGLELRS